MIKMEGDRITLVGLAIMVIGIILYSAWNGIYNTNYEGPSDGGPFSDTSLALHTLAQVTSFAGAFISVVGMVMSNDAVSFSLKTHIAK